MWTKRRTSQAMVTQDVYLRGQMGWAVPWGPALVLGPTFVLRLCYYCCESYNNICKGGPALSFYTNSNPDLNPANNAAQLVDFSMPLHTLFLAWNAFPTSCAPRNPKFFSPFFFSSLPASFFSFLPTVLPLLIAAESLFWAPPCARGQDI